MSSKIECPKCEFYREIVTYAINYIDILIEEKFKKYISKKDLKAIKDTLTQEFPDEP